MIQARFRSKRRRDDECDTKIQPRSSIAQTCREKKKREHTRLDPKQASYGARLSKAYTRVIAGAVEGSAVS